MSPAKKILRDLQASLKDAPAEEIVALENVILALGTVLLNVKDIHAQNYARMILRDELDALEALRSNG